MEFNASGEETIYVDCPCCGARLEARRQDGKVIKHWAKPIDKNKVKGIDPIKAAQERLKAEKERLSAYMAGAGEMLERQKRETLEKFEREKRRVIEEGDTSRPPSPFDND